MGILSKLAKMRPDQYAQGAADTFLSGVGGGAVGAGLGTALGGDDDMVPGMLAGAATGMGARGLFMALKRMLPQAGDDELMMLMKQIDEQNAAERGVRGVSSMPQLRPFDVGGKYGPRE